MKYLLILAAMSLVACGSKKDVSVNHHFCVMSDPRAVGDERYTCNVTAQFHSVGLCQSFQEWETKDNPDAYKDGRLKTKCEKE